LAQFLLKEGSKEAHWRYNVALTKETNMNKENDLKMAKMNEGIGTAYSFADHNSQSCTRRGQAKSTIWL
jgi:hypothetical protein